METKIATLATDWQERFSVDAEKSKMSRARKTHMSTFCLSSFVVAFCGCWEEAENVSANQRSWWSSLFSNHPNTQTPQKLVSTCFVKFRHIPFSEFREKSKMYQPIRGLGDHLYFPIGPKGTTNWVDSVDYLHLWLIEFRQIRFSGCKGEFEHTSATQRIGFPSFKYLFQYDRKTEVS